MFHRLKHLLNFEVKELDSHAGAVQSHLSQEDKPVKEINYLLRYKSTDLFFRKLPESVRNITAQHSEKTKIKE